MINIKEISTKELLELSGKNIKIIDVRSVEAYNGWKLHDEPRNGHIRGAKSLPVKWVDFIDWIEIVRAKDILPHHSLVLYSYDSKDSEKVVRQFIKTGYNDVKIYNSFLNEWNPDPELPMDYMERYRHLVSAHWLNRLISTVGASEYDNE